MSISFVMKGHTVVQAATAVVPTNLGPAPRAGVLASGFIVPELAGTAHADNFRRWAIVNKGQDGSGTTEMGYITTELDADPAGTNNVAFDVKAFTLSGTAANLVVAAGDVIAIVPTVGGTGLATSGEFVSLTFTPTYAVN